jgi:hypothetical protein
MIEILISWKGLFLHEGIWVEINPVNPGEILLILSNSLHLPGKPIVL